MVCPFLAINECFTIFHDKCFYKDECPDILYFATFPAIEVTLLFQIYNSFLLVLLELPEKKPQRKPAVLAIPFG